jgi:hypothetical protein
MRRTSVIEARVPKGGSVWLGCSLLLEERQIMYHGGKFADTNPYIITG